MQNAFGGIFIRSGGYDALRAEVDHGLRGCFQGRNGAPVSQNETRLTFGLSFGPICLRMRSMTIKAMLFASGLICCFGSGAFANSKCDAKFLNNMSANFFGLGCSREIPGACEIMNRYDGRPIQRNRQIERSITDDISQKDQDRAVKLLMDTMATIPTSTNPFAIIGKVLFGNSGDRSPCLGQATYMDEQGKTRHTSYWYDDKFVEMKDRPHSCMPDYELGKNIKVGEFFKIQSDKEKLKILEDESTCDYYQTMAEKIRVEIVSGKDAVKHLDRAGSAPKGEVKSRR